jgi:transposase-like protein
MSMTVGQFRAEVRRRRGARRRGAPRYPEGLREFALDHARAVLGSGGTVAAAARELGLSEMTLGSWLRSAGPSPRVRRVEVVADAQPSTAPIAAVTVTTPCGCMVSGLSVAQAAAFVRALR